MGELKNKMPKLSVKLYFCNIRKIGKYQLIIIKKSKELPEKVSPTF